MDKKIDSLTTSYEGNAPGNDFSAGGVVPLPDWLTTSEAYSPKPDHEGFITRSLLRIMGILRAFHQNADVTASRTSTWVKLLAVLFLIVLECTARNMFFVYVMLAPILVRLLFLHGSALKHTFLNAAGAAALSALLCLPAFFLGSPHTLFSVSLRVFESVSLIGVLSTSSPWNEITHAFKAFHLPDIFILTFDLTLKYIALLGEICISMLSAIKLRSVGRSQAKARSLSGVLGTAFLKSQEMSQEMYGAMMCRGFEGEYEKEPLKTTRMDRAVLLILLLILLFFLYMEHAM